MLPEWLMMMDTEYCLVESGKYSSVSSRLHEAWPSCCTKSAEGVAQEVGAASVCWSPSSSKRQPGLANHTSTRVTSQVLLKIDAAPASI